MNASNNPDPNRPVKRSFWLKALGWVLLIGSVGLVSCQALSVL